MSGTMTAGFVCIPRDIRAKESLQGDIGRLGAFVWLIQQAEWRDTEKEIGGHTVTIKRGQLSTSLRFLARAWGWSLGKVQRYTDDLHDDTLIDTAIAGGRCLITICNYDRFQGRKSDHQQDSDTASDTAHSENRYESNEKKEVEPNRHGADAPAEAVILDATSRVNHGSAKSALFNAGLAWLAKFSDRSEGSLRGALAHLMGEFSDAEVAAAVVAVERDEPAGDPVAYLRNTLARRRGALKPKWQSEGPRRPAGGLTAMEKTRLERELAEREARHA